MYTYAQKLVAARVRHKEGATQEEAGASIGAHQETIHRWETEGDEEWAKATEAVIAEMKTEGRGTAWRGLLKAAAGKTPDVAACKELLNRCEGAVPQEVNARVATTAQVALALSMADGGEAEQAPDDGSDGDSPGDS